MIINRHLIQDRLEQLGRIQPLTEEEAWKLRGQIEECQYWLEVDERFCRETPTIDLREIAH